MPHPRPCSHCSSSREVTDAHLVQLAASHGLKLATLDETLCRRPWSAGIAENLLGYGSNRITDHREGTGSLQLA